MSGEKSRAKKVEKKIDDSCAAALPIRSYAYGAAYVCSASATGRGRRGGGIGSMPSLLPSSLVSLLSQSPDREMQETESSLLLLVPSTLMRGNVNESTHLAKTWEYSSFGK